MSSWSGLESQLKTRRRPQARRSSSTGSDKSPATARTGTNQIEHRGPPPTMANSKQQQTSIEAATLSAWYRKVLGGGVKISEREHSTKTATSDKHSSTIVRAGTNFVDKFTYIIKKSNTLTRSESEFGSRAISKLGPKCCECSSSSSSGSSNTSDGSTASNSGSESTTSTSSNANSNRYLISSLSWRLARRCANKTKAVQFSSRSRRIEVQKRSESEDISTKTITLQSPKSDSSSMASALTKLYKRADQQTQHYNQQRREAHMQCVRQAAKSPSKSPISVDKSSSQRGSTSSHHSSSALNQTSDSILDNDLAAHQKKIEAKQVENRRRKEMPDKKPNSRGSFLSRARNSTINLASLAGVGHKFTCSASAGNLWWSSGHRRELAELSGDSQTVQPVDYVRAQFDQQQDHKQASDSNNNNTLATKTNNKSLLSATPTRKASSKKKKKHQSELEKVEKLRLLVSYLKSGHNQQLPKPVSLEADEIELAHKYKLHLILCEDCLQATELEQQQQQQNNQLGLLSTASSASNVSALNSNQQQQRHMGASTPEKSSIGIVINVRKSSENQIALSPSNTEQSAYLAGLSPSLSCSHTYETSPNCLSASQNLNMNSVSSPSINEQLSSFSPGSMLSASSSQKLLCFKCNKPTLRDRNSIMSSVDITANASVASDIDSNVSALNQDLADNAHLYHHHQDYHNPQHNNQNHLDQLEQHHRHHSQFHNSPRSDQLAHNQLAFLSSYRSMPGASMMSNHRGATTSKHHIGNISWALRHSISDPGANSTNCQLNSGPPMQALDDQFLIAGYDHHPNVSSFGGSSSGSSHDTSNNKLLFRRSSNFQSPKLFYIDDLERKDSDTSDTNSQLMANNMLARNHSRRYNQNNNKTTISSGEVARTGHPLRSWSSELFLSSTPTTVANNNNTVNQQNQNTINSNNKVIESSNIMCHNNQNQANTIESCDSNAVPTSKKTSAWTNPQNLATWIDNEVNSLVNDLEAKSQLVKKAKHAKSSKRRWLSSGSRRNSSGAHST